MVAVNIENVLRPFCKNFKSDPVDGERSLIQQIIIRMKHEIDSSIFMSTMHSERICPFE